MTKDPRQRVSSSSADAPDPNFTIAKAPPSPLELIVFDPDQWAPFQLRKAEARRNQLPADIRRVADEMISEPHMPPEVALEILEGLGASKRDRQRAIAALWKSGDEDERALALTRAAKRPPPPPNRLPWTRDAIRLVEKCIADPFDVATNDYRSALVALTGALKASEDDYKRKRLEGGIR